MPININKLDLKKLVLIIGAGPSGLVSARWAKEYGFTPLLIEKTDQIGGLWHYGTWPTMQTNLSKFSLFSDLDWEGPEMFLSSSQMLKYLQQYANKFKLHDNILFNTQVESVSRNDNFWQVVIKDQTDIRKTLSSQQVVIASGFFNTPYIPDITDLGWFNGQIVHSHNYKDLSPTTLANKHVLVVGNGFSAIDIVPEIAKVAKVTQIITKPHWIIPRYLPLPLDLGLASYQRANRQNLHEVTIKTTAEYQKANAYLAKFCKPQTDPMHPLYIDPSSTAPPFVSISDIYMDLVSQRQINILRGKVAQFTKHSIITDAGKELSPIDVVLFCTGYQTFVPFLDKHTRNIIFSAPDNKLQPHILYKSMLHPDLPGLAFIGMYRGPYFTIMELQARLACMLFAGKVQISNAQMQAGINEERIIRVRSGAQFPHSDFVGFASDLAELIGCAPDLDKLKALEPKLHTQLLNGPVTATDFRIHGPNAKYKLYKTRFEKIRQTIMKVDPQHPCLPQKTLTWSNAPMQGAKNTLLSATKKVLKLRF